MPWTDLWSDDYRSDPRPYKHFEHCLTNIASKLGTLFQMVEMSDHYGQDYTLGLNKEKASTALAIIVMSALKAANSYPGSPINLDEYIERDLKRRAKSLDAKNA